MITVFIITDNIPKWAEDMGYPLNCITHTREKSIVQCGMFRAIIMTHLPFTMRGYKVDKWILDKPVTADERDMLELFTTPVRVVETENFKIKEEGE